MQSSVGAAWVVAFRSSRSGCSRKSSSVDKGVCACRDGKARGSNRGGAKGLPQLRTWSRRHLTGRVRGSKAPHAHLAWRPGRAVCLFSLPPPSRRHRGDERQATGPFPHSETFVVLQLSCRERDMPGEECEVGTTKGDVGQHGRIRKGSAAWRGLVQRRMPMGERGLSKVWTTLRSRPR